MTDYRIDGKVLYRRSLGPFRAPEWHQETWPGEPRFGWRGLLDRLLRRDPPPLIVTVIDKIEPSAGSLAPPQERTPPAV